MAQGPFTILRNRISRSSSTVPRYSVRRLALVSATFIALFLTNPGNKGITERLHSGWNSNESDLARFSSFLWPSVSTSSISNYVVFSLEKRMMVGVDILALTRSFPLCRYESTTFGWICDSVAHHLCHGKPILDVSDRPYTAHRLLCSLLICTWILSMVEAASWDQRYTIKGFRFGSTNILVKSFGSVIPQPVRAMDFVYLNMHLYPTFVSLDRFVLAYSFNGSPSWNFYLWAVAFIFGIGAMSNRLVATIFPREQNFNGLSPVVAGSLGFQQGIQTTAFIHVFGLTQSPSTVFWTHVAFAVVVSTPGTVVSLLAGGSMGYAFGKHLLDQISVWDLLWV